MTTRIRKNAKKKIKALAERVGGVYACNLYHNFEPEKVKFKDSTEISEWLTEKLYKFNHATLEITEDAKHATLYIHSNSWYELYFVDSERLALLKAKEKAESEAEANKIKEELAKEKETERTLAKDVTKKLHNIMGELYDIYYAVDYGDVCRKEDLARIDKARVAVKDAWACFGRKFNSTEKEDTPVEDDCERCIFGLSKETVEAHKRKAELGNETSVCEECRALKRVVNG